MERDKHVPSSEVAVQAEVFKSCWTPSAYLLEKHFGWMSEYQREQLGRKAEAALEQAFIEQFEEMWDSDESDTTEVGDGAGTQSGLSSLASDD